MIKRYINLTIYILILLTIVLIISRRDIIERYVDITKFGSFKDCNICEDGKELKWCGGLNSGSCELCPAGKAGIGGICNISCTGNEYSSVGATSCSTCGNGERPNRNRSGCDDCPKGTAGTDGYCNRCTNNQYSSSQGATSCLTCPNGKQPNRNRSTCNDCPSGTAGMGGLCNIRCTGNKYSTGGTTSCSTCDMDGYSVNSNNTACQACPAGSDGKGGYCNNVSQIVCGGYHTIFLTDLGKVYGCGYNTRNQINSSYFHEITRPTEITDIPTGETITQIACGYYHTMFLTNSGKVYGRGNNYYNQVSSNTGDIIYLTEITDFPETVETITQIACGRWHTMFLTDLGEVYGCGWNSSYQINSDGGTINSPTQVTILPIGSTDEIIQIACGHYHTMFLTNSGKVYGYGMNYSKQINSDGGIITMPTEITDFPANETITQITCGYLYTMYLTTSGKVYRIGNYLNQPTEITNFSPQLDVGEIIIQIACGELHTIFLTSYGKVYGIGNNDKNQINSDGGFIAQPTIIKDFPTDEEIIQIACGGEHTMFLTSSEKVYGCGYNLTKNKELIIL